MSKKERLEHNAKGNGISVAQAKRLDYWMNQKISDWPEKLKLKLNELQQECGFCGEIAVSAIVICLKTGEIQ